MRRALGVLAVVFATSVTAAEEPVIYESAADLTASLAKISQTAITRDNEVSLFLTELQLAPVEATPEQVRYALVVDVELLADVKERTETFSYVIDQPIQHDASSQLATLASAFRTIFTNRPLKDYREIHMRLNLLRLDAAERDQFGRVASLFGSVVSKSMFQPLLNVLGVNSTAATSPKVIAFEGRFIVPTNYSAHQNARRIGLPALTNDEPIAIAYQVSSPRSNTSVVSYLKNVGNRIAQVVVGKEIARNVDKVQGFATFLFTKTQFSPVPGSLNDSLMDLKVEAEQMELQPDFQKGAFNNAVFLFNKLKNDMPSVGRESVITYLELAKLYHEFRKAYESEAVDAALRKSIALKFAAWLEQSGNRLHQKPSYSPPVRGIYPVDAQGASQRYPIIINPYGLSDDLVLSAVQWQLRMHEVMAEWAKESGTSYKRFTFNLASAAPGA